MHIKLTEKAAQRIETMALDNKVKNDIRIMVVGGGCSGLSYDMDFKKDDIEGDLVFDSHNVDLYIDPMSYDYLQGLEIDYIETFAYSGFQFNNPNAQKSCGCGSSFAV